uniref:cytochrome c biogenesis protein CcsA n=1 Tax=Candidatus Cryptobacteroides bacterium TaxID=3085639 RepID=UPI004025FDE6
MSWDSFAWFALAASLFWISGAIVSVISKRRLPAAVLAGCGSAIFMTFIVGVWISLGRPPLRTMGETRLWFSLFLSLIGLVVYLRWRYRWVLPFGCLMAVMFASINIFKPEIHTEELMPALRSPWFVPHVIVYMFAYAVMGIATILALRILWLTRRSAAGSAPAPGSTTPATVDAAASPLSPSLQGDLRLCDTLVRMGWGFITMGIVMGALWAKQAWGDYWTWDPKETWAAATWLSYLLYMHLRQQGSALSSVTSAGSVTMARQNSPAIEVASHSNKALHRTLFLLIFSFLLLQMCWWGVNYLPSAQGFSLHTY